MANLMDQKTKYLLGRWNKRVAMVEKAQGKALTFEQKACLVNTLENTHQRMKAMEATNPSAIGQYKRYALDIVTSVVPNLIAFDIYAVQAMDNRIGMINYIDYKYSKTKGTGLGQKDHTFASSINMGQSDPWYTTDTVRDVVLGTGDGEKVAFTATFSDWTPVIPNSVDVTVEGGQSYHYTSSSNSFIGDDGESYTGSVSTDGAISITLTTAPASGAKVTTTYRFNNEDVRSDGPEQAGFTNVPEIELKINSLPIEAKARTLRSFWSFDAQYELQKEYGQDIETLLATQSTGEIAHEIDNELTLDLVDFANAGTPLVWSRTLTPGIALVDHYDSFMVKLNEGANRIFDATRKVKANFMVCGIDVATVVESMRNFTPSGVTAIGPHFLGTLGNYKVFVNPDYKANEFVLGYKGSNMLDAGAFYCPYMPVSSTDLIMDANFRGQRGYATMYGKALLNDKMYIKGYVTD